MKIDPWLFSVYIFLWIGFPFHLTAETIDVIAFPAPPIMGETKYSKDGLQVDLIKAILKISSTQINVEMLPRARANAYFEEGKKQLFLGPVESLNRKFRKHCSKVPLFVVHNVLFYKKSRFPNFSITKIEELGGYLIGCIFGGSSAKTAQKRGLNIDTAKSYKSLFLKLTMDRNDFLIAPILSGKLAVEKNFPMKISEFAYYEDTPVLMVAANVIINKNLDKSGLLTNKIKNGLKSIWESGTWIKIMEKYYGKNRTPKQSSKTIGGYCSSI